VGLIVDGKENPTEITRLGRHPIFGISEILSRNFESKSREPAL